MSYTLRYKYTKNLDNWESMHATKNCYLDGGYFNKVFEKYPGLLTNVLHIKYKENNKYINMLQSNISSRKIKLPLLLRVIIETEKSKHSNLLILDLPNRKVYRFEPLGKSAPYFHDTSLLISNYLSEFFDFTLEIIDTTETLDTTETIKTKYLDERNPVCYKSGFCVAYCILYAYCFLNQVPFRPENIRKFVSKLVLVYSEIDTKDIEYGFLNGKPTSLKSVGIGAGLGGLGGVLIGGPSGLVVGALAGGLAGSAF